jgi:transketolase
LVAKDREARIKEIEGLANVARKRIIKMIGKANSGHPGGSLSAIDIITTLYFGVMRHDPENPSWANRDRFILSKGHAAPALYATLAQARYFPVEHLMTLRRLGSPLQGHPDMKRLPGIEASTGSLGQGLSVAVGMAVGLRLDKRPSRVYVMLGDGECDEGSVWEAAMSAAHFKLDNLTAIVDKNSLQIDGSTECIMCLEPLKDKWKAFGWHVIGINGHDIGQILDALDEAERTSGKPTMIVADTVKGKGVSFMEGQVAYHGKAPSQKEVEKALHELGGDE